MMMAATMGRRSQSGVILSARVEAIIEKRGVRNAQKRGLLDVLV